MRTFKTYIDIKSEISKDTLNELLQQYTYKEIGEKYNCNKRLISKLAKEYEIPKNYKIIVSHCVKKLDEDYILNAYLNDKKSLRQIGDELHVQHSVIKKRLQKYDIDIRPFNYDGYYDNRRGLRDTTPLRRLDMAGYVVIFVNGEVIREHRHVMECHLHRKLDTEEHVHHIDFNKQNNNIENLFLFSSGKYHSAYHGYLKTIDDYISPQQYLDTYKNIYDKVTSYNFLYKMYIEEYDSANLISQLIYLQYGYPISRGDVVEILKKHNIYYLREPITNQYDKGNIIQDISHFLLGGIK